MRYPTIIGGIFTMFYRRIGSAFEERKILGLRSLITGRLIAAYRAPEVRALASRYGDPKELLVDDWSPHLPGINAPGRYEDYAKDPWKTQVMVMKKIEASSYEYFYPAVKKKK